MMMKNGHKTKEFPISIHLPTDNKKKYVFKYEE
jgi:hypothetical protein